MGMRVGLVAAAMGVLAASAQGGAAAEAKTWYVYCEGANADGHWAVFSENFWPHPETADYGHRVGSAAKAFFEERHAVSLEGCAGVNFRDDGLAEHSRRTTAQLHRRMGDRVYFFPLPNEVLREDAVPDPEPAFALRASVYRTDASDISGASVGASAGDRDDARWPTAPR